jgi:hypothetical protein
MRRAIATLLATVAACGVVACGGDDGSDGDRASKEGRDSITDRAAETDRAETDRAPVKSNPSTADGVTPPGGGKKVLGGFGREPTSAERAAIAAAVDRYHQAVAADDDARICAQMSRASKRELTRNVAGDGSARCEDHVGVLYSGFTDAIRDVLDEARITELRVEGDHAIVIAIIPGPRTIKLPMDREQGTWRFGTFGKWAPAI